MIFPTCIFAPKTKGTHTLEILGNKYFITQTSSSCKTDAADVTASIHPHRSTRVLPHEQEG